MLTQRNDDNDSCGWCNSGLSIYLQRVFVFWWGVLTSSQSHGQHQSSVNECAAPPAPALAAPSRVAGDGPLSSPWCHPSHCTTALALPRCCFCLTGKVLAHVHRPLPFLPSFSFSCPPLSIYLLLFGTALRISLDGQSNCSLLLTPFLPSVLLLLCTFHLGSNTNVACF